MKKDLELPHYYLVVFGVSGSGKTLVGSRLAEKLNIEFIEGDDLHPEGNILKMQAGHPLSDADRVPWLNTIVQKMTNKIDAKESFALSCSALKKNYRDILRNAGDIRFLFLNIRKEVVGSRLEQRKDHFMPASLLYSQMEILEEPSENELDVISIDADQNLEDVVKQIINKINQE